MAKLLLLLFFAHSFVLTVCAALASQNYENYSLQRERIKRSPYVLLERLYEVDVCNGTAVDLHQRHGRFLYLSVWHQEGEDSRNEAAQLGTCQLTVEATSRKKLSYQFIEPDSAKVSNLSCEAKLNIYDSVGFLRRFSCEDELSEEEVIVDSTTLVFELENPLHRTDFDFEILITESSGREKFMSSVWVVLAALTLYGWIRFEN